MITVREEYDELFFTLFMFINNPEVRDINYQIALGLLREWTVKAANSTHLMTANYITLYNNVFFYSNRSLFQSINHR